MHFLWLFATFSEKNAFFPCQTILYKNLLLLRLFSQNFLTMIVHNVDSDSCRRYFYYDSKK